MRRGRREAQAQVSHRSRRCRWHGPVASRSVRTARARRGARPVSVDQRGRSGLAALALVAMSYPPTAPASLGSAAPALIPGAILVHFRSVALLVRKPRPSAAAVLAGMPRLPLAAFIVLFIGASVAADSSIGHLAGAPTAVGGHYYLNDHGDYIRVSYASYLHALALQQRGFASVASVFYGLGVLVNLRGSQRALSSAEIGQARPA